MKRVTLAGATLKVPVLYIVWLIMVGDLCILSAAESAVEAIVLAGLASRIISHAVRLL